MNVLVVSPHPDDETLGAGGMILKLMAQGHHVFWMNVTGMLHSDKYTKEQKEKREEQLYQIEKFYNFSSGGVFHLNLPTTKLESIESDKAIDQIADIIRQVKPEVLILPDYNDAHSDHKKVFDWCFACSKVFRFPYIRAIITMEIISETDFGRPENPFVPNIFVDITEHMEQKIEALRIYHTEMGKPPFPRSEANVRALATVRGAMAGVRYAEAFRLVKCIY